MCEPVISYLFKTFHGPVAGFQFFTLQTSIFLKYKRSIYKGKLISLYMVTDVTYTKYIKIKKDSEGLKGTCRSNFTHKKVEVALECKV